MKQSLRWLMLSVLVVPGLGAAEEPPKAERVAIARAVTETGTLLRREAPDKAWQVVKKGEELYTGDLLIGLPGAALQTNDGAYRLTLQADVAKQGPFPILEAGVVLRKQQGLNLDFYLDRGRVEVQALTDKESRFTFTWTGKDPCTFTTSAKGTTALLETFARWAPGVPFNPKGGPDHKPVADLIFLVTKGEVLACTRDAEIVLRAPPGTAGFTFNSLVGRDPRPHYLEKLPVWLTDEEKGPVYEKARERFEAFRKLIAEKGPGEAIDAFLASGDPDRVRAAIIAMSATDDIARLRQTFYNSKSPEVLDLCIQVLRHWLGRDASHDVKFYDLLRADPKIPPALPATAMQLLHTFSETDLAQVELYEVLVGYLRHEALGIRGLAYYHLSRLYPEGKKFGFNPAGTPQERAAAVARWQEAIETKKLPPKKP